MTRMRLFLRGDHGACTGYRLSVSLNGYRPSDAGLIRGSGTLVTHSSLHRESMEARCAIAGTISKVRADYSEDDQDPGLETGIKLLSRQGYLNDRARHWHPHVMFFLPSTEAAAWGANLAGSPIFEDDNAPDRMTVFTVPVAKWSDGTYDSDDGH